MSGMGSGGYATHYDILQTERFEAERDTDAIFYLTKSGADFAGIWLIGLETFVAGLALFPGPYSHPVDQDATRLFGRETRRALYYGPTRKRSAIPYRILFTVTEPDTNDDAGIILILRILHGSRLPLGGETGSESE